MRTDRELFAFDDEDLEGTIQPHDDTLVVTAQISGLLVKRIMINQGSRADVMYLDLFKRLGLKNQDLIKYDTPLVSFDERVVIPEGQISEYGRKRSDTNLYRGQFVFPIHSNLGKAVDSHHGGLYRPHYM